MQQAAVQLEQDFDLVYDKIANLYDRAESILKTAYHESVKDHEAFLARIEPIVQQIEESANILAEDFSAVIESEQEPTNAMKIRVSSALRRILLQIDEFRSKLEELEKSGG